MLFCHITAKSVDFQIITKSFSNIHSIYLITKNIMKILSDNILNNYAFKYSILNFIFLQNVLPQFKLRCI